MSLRAGTIRWVRWHAKKSDAFCHIVRVFASVCLHPPYKHIAVLMPQRASSLCMCPSSAYVCLLCVCVCMCRVCVCVRACVYPSQVRRMFRAVGNEVVTLHRVSIGALTLPDDVARGEYRTITAEEMERVFQQQAADEVCSCTHLSACSNIPANRYTH